MDYEFDYWHFIYVKGEYYISTKVEPITVYDDKIKDDGDN